MKKILYLLSVFLSTQLFGQITLTSADFATTNDTVRMSSAMDPNIDFTTTGPSQNWDFSNLTPTIQGIKYFQPVSNAGAFVNFIFGTFAPVKYQASYFLPSTDLPLQQITSFLPIGIQDVFQFTKRSADSITSVGIAMTVSFNGSATTIPIQSDTIETPYDFPLAYGNSHFSRGATNVDFNPIYNAKWTQHRTRLTTVDGYGSITTPFGTFDALRIRHDIDEIDSLYTELPFLGGTWIPLDIPISHQYEWWTNGEKEPILRIKTTEILGNETVTAIEYRDFYRAEFAELSENFLSDQLTIFPNPAYETIEIKAPFKLEAFTILNASGQIIYNNACNDTILKIDVSSYEPGPYWIYGHTNQGTFVKSILIK
jgi:hypothetical protein